MKIKADQKRRSHRNFDERKLCQQIKKRRWIASVAMIIVLMVVFWLFIVLWRGRHYMLISAFVLVVIMVSFLFVLQQRPPRAREIVLLASLSAFCVLANELCAHTLPLHAGTAMVILTGIACGPEAGFAVGAVSRLVCNFFDGQGAWTPWEMISWGILGYSAGLFFVKPAPAARCDNFQNPGSQQDAAARSDNLQNPGFQQDAAARCDNFQNPGSQQDAAARCDNFQNPGFQQDAAARSDNLQNPGSQQEQKNEKQSKKELYTTMIAMVGSMLIAQLTAYILYLIQHAPRESFFGWRIYVFGFLGLIAGGLLQRHPLPVNTITMAGFTLFTVFILYGGVMNFATLFLKNMVDSSQNAINIKVLKSLFVAGVPYDFAHAVTAAFCMVIFGKPILQKLRRIQIKYGMYGKDTR
jgi:energy-coupling factor transport system substrate-specific component